MPVLPADLRALPLFHQITDEHLERLLATFDRRALAAGTTLFKKGEIADKFLLLVAGEVSIREGDDERFRLKPIQPVGELGTIVGLERATTAVAATDCEVLTIGVEPLVKFFEAHGDVGFPFHHNLLQLVADKVVRDGRLISEMRTNIIQTQKAMKRMREALLEAEETPVSRLMYEQIDALIEQNKKGHYVVDVPKYLPLKLRLDDGAPRDVVRLSNEWLHVARGTGNMPAKGVEVAAVLTSADVEIPVSGTVESIDGDHFVICLDMLIDDYARALDDLLTRLLMLDVVL